ncbi:major facilitator superfamily domain-containing protein [Aspergillus undulatus]|uniref:major facilitator superfamily domain-containing protein n=1 Tax=Aspergillus undulatus TaxID=1810928 RepID=UPI003CCCAE39
MELADQETEEWGYRDIGREGTFQITSDARHRQLLLDADEFVTKYELDELRGEIRTGALLLDSPTHTGCVEHLTDEEIRMLSSEDRPPPFIKGTLNWWWRFPCLCTVGGLLFGLMQMGHSLNIATGIAPPSPVNVISGKNEYVSLACMIIGCWCAVPLLNYFGRRGAALRAAGVWLVGTIGALIFTNTALDLLSLSGIVRSTVNGMFACIMPMYLAESSPSPKRGSFMVAWYLSQFTGALLAGACLGYVGFSGLGNEWMSLLYRLLILPAIGFVACIWVSSESPYWCTRQGKMRQAHGALSRSRDITVQASRDLYRMHLFYAQQKRASKGRRETVSLSRLAQVLANYAIPAFSGLVVNVFASLVSISATSVGTSREAATELAPYTALLVFSSCLVAIMPPMMINLVERVGRRSLTLTGMALTSLALLVTRLLACRLPVLHPVRYLVPPLLLMGFNGGLSLAYQVYIDEISCSGGSETTIAATMTGVIIRGAISQYSVAKIIEHKRNAMPWTSLNLTLAAPLTLLFILNVVLALLLSAVMVETRRSSLEELSATLNIPVFSRAAYRVRVYLPYLFKRFILWRSVELQPFEQTRYADGMVRLKDDNVLSGLVIAI